MPPCPPLPPCASSASTCRAKPRSLSSRRCTAASSNSGQQRRSGVPGRARIGRADRSERAGRRRAIHCGRLRAARPHEGAEQLAGRVERGVPQHRWRESGRVRPTFDARCARVPCRVLPARLASRAWTCVLVRPARMPCALCRARALVDGCAIRGGGVMRAVTRGGAGQFAGSRTARGRTLSLWNVGTPRSGSFVHGP